MLTRRHHAGAALLAFVAALMLLAGSACTAIVHFLLASRQLATLQLDRDIAFHAAEAALKDAEADLIAAVADANSSRLAAWPMAGACANGAQRGICRSGERSPVWQAWLDGRMPDGIGVELGTFTGAALPPMPEDAIGATRVPHYLIEMIDKPESGQAWPRMRIVGLGVGRDPSVRVLLQAEFQP